ncbi:MAG: sugar ABC transporter ATP-binding protein [Limisphaerales bacterium]
MRESPARTQNALEVTRLSKSFPGVQALDRVSLSLRRAEIHALIGENGAGKSTLMKVLAGIVAKDNGELLLDGQPIAPASPAEALRLGLSTVHQEISLAPNLTVAENIFVGQAPTRLGFIRWRELERRTRELLAPFGVHLAPAAQVCSLNLAMRQIVEIARAVAATPKILMLDEPTSSLEDHEVARLFRVLRSLAAQGIGILYVTHKLNEVFAIADTVTVLRDGKWVATQPVAETSLDEIVRQMVGRELTQLYPPKSSRRGPELLRVEDLRSNGNFEKISFTLRAGEILGLAGLVGAGRSEIAQTLFGYRPKDAGKIWLRGNELEIDSPADAVRHGIAYLPEDRKLSGLFGQMSLEDNLVAANLAKYSRFGLLSSHAIGGTARECVERFRIRTPTVRQRIGLISGGNQQKVLLGRWLDTRPQVLIADEPTRGIDVGAKAEIHALLRRLCDEGIGVIVISSELPEILGLCDRVLVLHEGRLAGELAGDDVSEEAIMRLATGQTAVID